MFGIDSMEFAIIIVVAILVLGPDQLPKILRTFYKVMAEFRRISTEFQRAINLDSHFAEMEKAEAEAKAKKQEAQQTAKKKSIQKEKNKNDKPGSPSTAQQADETSEGPTQTTTAPLNSKTDLTSPSNQTNGTAITNIGDAPTLHTMPETNPIPTSLSGSAILSTKTTIPLQPVDQSSEPSGHNPDTDERLIIAGGKNNE